MLKLNFTCMMSKAIKVSFSVFCFCSGNSVSGFEFLFLCNILFSVTGYILKS